MKDFLNMSEESYQHDSGPNLVETKQLVNRGRVKFNGSGGSGSHCPLNPSAWTLMIVVTEAAFSIHDSAQPQKEIFIN